MLKFNILRVIRLVRWVLSRSQMVPPHFSPRVLYFWQSSQLSEACRPSDLCDGWLRWLGVKGGLWPDMKAFFFFWGLIGPSDGTYPFWQWGAGF